MTVDIQMSYDLILRYKHNLQKLNSVCEQAETNKFNIFFSSVFFSLVINNTLIIMLTN